MRLHGCFAGLRAFGGGVVRLGLSTLFVLGTLSACVAPPANRQPLISSASELPVASYELPALPSELIIAETFPADLLAAARQDIEGLLAGYAFADVAYERELGEALARIAFLQHDYSTARSSVARLRGPLANKETDAHTSLLLLGVLLTGDDAAFEERLSNALEDMPFEVVRDTIRRKRFVLLFLSEASVESRAKETLDKSFAANGSLTRADMLSLIDLRFDRDALLPRRTAALSAFSTYWRANETPKPDIWSARAADPSVVAAPRPVVVAVWDDGTDIGRFAGQLWRNLGETLNGRDDDANGFVDDIHGIGFDVAWRRTPALLREPRGRLLSGDDLMSAFVGVSDLAKWRDTEAASRADALIQGLSADELARFWEDMRLAVSYTHGTHVAGIVLENNPFAQLLVVRQTWDHRTIPDLQLEDYFRRRAQGYRDIARYLSDAGVRVVNMSWGENAAVIENILSLHGIEPDPEARRAMAERLFAIDRAGFEDAIRATPSILYIASAGNEASDSGFSRSYPAAVAAPNLVAVGASDSAGAEAPFTSYGDTVLLYANGSDVVSELPGAGDNASSGTSFAAPQVAHLASLLLAARPELSPGEVVAIMRETATPSDDGKLHLIHPAAALERVTAGTKAPVTRP